MVEDFLQGGRGGGRIEKVRQDQSAGRLGSVDAAAYRVHFNVDFLLWCVDVRPALGGIGAVWSRRWRCVRVLSRRKMHIFLRKMNINYVTQWLSADLFVLL